MRLLKIGELLINIDQLVSVELRPDIYDLSKVIGTEPNPRPSLGGGPTRPVYAKLNVVRITTREDTAYPQHTFYDAEADAVRAWFIGDGRGVITSLVNLTPRKEAEPDAARANPANFREFT